MATIRKKGDFQWHAQIRRKGFPATTKTHETEDAAIKWARDIESKMDKGIFFDRNEAEKTTLGDLIDTFLKEHALTNTNNVTTVKRPINFNVRILKNGSGNTV